MKSWRALLPRSVASPRPSPVLDPRATDTEHDEIPRYPPFARGLPAASVERVLSTQTELLGAIRHTLALPSEVQQTILQPVLHRYAAFTHLLPASEAHHHRGAGGLFRHGLEVAHTAALASEGILFGLDATPLARKALEPRWRLAVCLAGLLHDIGKPVSDLAIVDRDGTTPWNPYLETLTDWASRHGIERYFLRWRDHRHQRHEQFSVLVSERVLTPASLAYLTASGPDILQAMLEAIAGQDRGTAFHALVIDADRKSVERDLKANHLPTDASLGVPVEKYLLDAMRRLLASGRWTVNARGSRVWRFADGVHVVWKTAARDIGELLAQDRIGGIPQDPDTLADILIERELATARTTSEGQRYRYWPMLPSVLDTPLFMLRLAAPELIFSGEPPLVVAGRVVDESHRVEQTAEAAAAVPPEANPTLLPPRTPSSVDATSSSTRSASQETTATVSTAMTGGNATNTVSRRLNGASKTSRPDARPIAPSGEPDAQRTTAALPTGIPASAQPSTVMAEPSVPTASTSALASTSAWLANQGAAGAWLLRAVETTRAADPPPVYRMDGHIVLPYPAFPEHLGDEPTAILHLLDTAGWIAVDIRAPMRKLRVVAGIKGLVLTTEVSRCWVELGGKTKPVAASDVGPDDHSGSDAGSVSGSSTHPDSLPKPVARRRVKSSQTVRTAAAVTAPSLPQARLSTPGHDPSPPDGAVTASPPALPPRKAPARQSAEPPTPTPSAPPDDSLDALIQWLCTGHALPFPIREDPDGWQVSAALLDWYVARQPTWTRSRLIIALHRHPQTHIDGDTLRIRRLPPSAPDEE